MPEFVHYEVENRVAVLTIDNPPVNALGAGVWEAIDQGVARANDDSTVDAIVLIGAGQHLHRGRRHQHLQDAEDARPVDGALRGHARPAPPSRRLGQAARRRDPRPGVRRRARGCHGLPLPRRRQGREGRTARSAPRHHPRRGRHAAAAAARRRAAGDRDVHRRQAGTGREGEEPPASSTRSSMATCGRAQWRSRRARAAAGDRRKTREIAISADQVDCRTRRLSGGPRRARQIGARRAGARLAAVDAIEACLERGFDDWIDPRARALRRMRRLDRIEGAAPPLLRRARSRQGAGRPQGHARQRHSARRRRRRRHDGRRDRDELRERRYPGASQGGGRRGAAARAGDDPQELRSDDVQGQDDRRTTRKDDGAHHAHHHLRRLRPGRHRRRGGVREHGAEEEHVRGARRAWSGPTACSRPIPPHSTSTSSRSRAAGLRRSSGTTSSARRTS